jgi:hypothetical protein
MKVWIRRSSRVAPFFVNAGVYGPHGQAAGIRFALQLGKLQHVIILFDGIMTNVDGCLSLIVKNARFLILPSVHSKNLASKILAIAGKHLAIDSLNRYNIQSILIEAFIELLTGLMFLKQSDGKSSDHQAGKSCRLKIFFISVDT